MPARSDAAQHRGKSRRPVDFYYLPKVIAITLIRLILPLYTKFTHPTQPPVPRPSRRLFYSPSTSSRRHALRFYVYEPSTPSDKPLPIHLSTQGSGFSLHTFGADASFCKYIADSVPCIVIDFETRKGPEHCWPAPVDDVHDAVARARELALQYGWDAERISIGGFSSGGCLALVEAAREPEGTPLRAVVAFYPSTNLAEDAFHKPGVSVEGSKGAGGDVPPLIRRLFYACYVPKSLNINRADPLVSPYHADAASFPPSVTVVTCTLDSLAREGVALVEKLREARPDCVVHFSAEGQGHDFDHACKQGSQNEMIKWEAYNLARDRLRDAFAS